ncbi:MAG: hypothetical protein WC747_04060 [Candidatus Babeliales bacterium]
MKKLLLAVTAIMCMNGQAQASWASATRMGVVTVVANTPLMYAVWSHKVESARIGNDVVNSIQAATAKLNQFTPLMNHPALQDKSNMGWTEWAASGTGNFMSHVFNTVLTTIAIQLVMSAAMSTMQNAATSMMQEEDTPEVKPTPAQAKPGLAPAPVQAKPIVPQAKK